MDQNPAGWFGNIDIYIFDLILKGRLTPNLKILDAGSGEGRNLIYFLKTGFDVSAVDQSETSIRAVRDLASQLAPQLPATNFRVELVDKLSFADRAFDVVLSSAVLHFARNQDHWRAMVAEMWRVLKPGGIFFARLASTIGIEDKVRAVGDGRFLNPDGSERFLVNAEMLFDTTRSLRGKWLEPFKTVVVHDQRSMSNWCLRKS